MRAAHARANMRGETHEQMSARTIRGGERRRRQRARTDAEAPAHTFLSFVISSINYTRRVTSDPARGAGFGFISRA